MAATEHQTPECTFTADDVFNYSEDLSESVENPAMEQHVQTCAKCREILSGIQRVSEAAQQIKYATNSGGAKPRDAAPPPLTIGDYKILSLIAEGGMGKVFKAYDPTLDRLLALKVMKDELSENEAFCKRFVAEAKTLAKLNHPNIVLVHTVARHEQQLYIAMELIEGQSLLEKIRSRRLVVDEAVQIFRQILEGVRAAHENQVIHRDIKPANVMVTSTGLIKVLDFGLAKELLGDASHTVTEAGVVLGTLAYVAPEVAMGKNATKQSDIYALGLVFYQMLTDRIPFSDTSATFELIERIKTEELAPPSTLNPKIPARLERLILKMCAKNPAERYASVSAVLNDLASAPRPEHVQPPASRAVSNANKSSASNIAVKSRLHANELKASRPRKRPSASPLTAINMAVLALVAAALLLVYGWSAKSNVSPTLPPEQTHVASAPTAPITQTSVAQARVPAAIKEAAPVAPPGDRAPVASPPEPAKPREPDPVVAAQTQPAALLNAEREPRDKAPATVDDVGDDRPSPAHQPAKRDDVPPDPVVAALASAKVDPAPEAVWVNAQESFNAKRFKEAQELFQSFSRLYANTAAGTRHSEELKQRLASIETALKPAVKEGIAAFYFKNKEMKDNDLAASRVESKLEFKWGTEDTLPDGVVPEQFATRFMGLLNVEKAGHYTFTVLTDDGVRMWLNGQQLVNQWHDIKDPAQYTIEVDLPKGAYELRLEHYHVGGLGSCGLRWALKDGFTETRIPANALLLSPKISLLKP